MDSNDRELQEVLKTVSVYLRDADRREREAATRHKETIDAHARGYASITKAITEGFRLVHDAILDTRRN